jgi:Co/Zn/Cd efflux system component
VLVTLLAINALMFLIEATIGWLAQSTALLADSLDMLADATVFGIALLAAGRSTRFKTRAAFSTGGFQLVLGLAVCVDVSRRFLYGSEPKSALIICIIVIRGGDRNSAQRQIDRTSGSCLGRKQAEASRS